MQLGTFSLSLNVKDIKTSEAFYGKLGFETVGGKAEQGWLILRNGATTIGLFQGMFKKNMLTFNPGWDDQAKPLEKFTDIREVQRKLKSKGVKFQSEADEEAKGPDSFIIADPDGNPILVDQHV